MSEFLRDLRRASHILFVENPRSYWIGLRLWIGFKILPKDLSNLMFIVLSKIEAEYEKMDSDKKDKISSLTIDFEFRD